MLLDFSCLYVMLPRKNKKNEKYTKSYFCPFFDRYESMNVCKLSNQYFLEEKIIGSKYFVCSTMNE